MTSTNWAELAGAASESGTSFDPIPDGDYEMRVVEAESKRSQSDKQMFVIKAQVQSGPHANRLVWDNLVVSEGDANALGFFFRKMQALGLGREFFAQNLSNDQIVSALQGRPFRARVETRVWQGNPKNNIKQYHPASQAVGGAQAPAPVPTQAAPPVPVQQAPIAPQGYPAPVQQPQVAQQPVAPPPPPAPAQGGSPWDSQVPAPPTFNSTQQPPF